MKHRCVEIDESGANQTLTGAELEARVASVAATLRDLASEVIAGWLPRELRAAGSIRLATVSLGAVAVHSRRGS